jgi:hypothetical protein
MLGLGFGGFILGVGILGGGISGALGTDRAGASTVTDPTALSIAAAVGGLLTIGCPVAAAVWRALEKPTGHQFTLTGRVRIVMRAIPNAAGQRPAQGVGDGESHIVIDEGSDSGYTNLLHVPEPK